MEILPTVKDITMENMVVRKQRRWALKKCYGFILQAFRKAVNLKARDRVLGERDGKSLFLQLLLSFLRNETQQRIKLSPANCSSMPRLNWDLQRPIVSLQPDTNQISGTGNGANHRITFLPTVLETETSVYVVMVH